MYCSSNIFCTETWQGGCNLPSYFTTYVLRLLLDWSKVQPLTSHSHGSLQRNEIQQIFNPLLELFLGEQIRHQTLTCMFINLFKNNYFFQFLFLFNFNGMFKILKLSIAFNLCDIACCKHLISQGCSQEKGLVALVTLNDEPQ